ncbi:DUF4157 domain-containing protein [Myxococcus eversor]|uniref:eCIS core domain-containing protein n=1 Tax=Myxococcus eversor TaxID=2709661 RepID=UPI0019686CED|nr:DUF4157 domain-containing protein [Myxococcus eversor]
MGVFVQESLSTRDESISEPSSVTAGGNSRARALGEIQRAFDSSPRVVAQAKQAQTLQRRASPRNDTGLPDGLKSGVESLSGMSMDDVRVHYNSSAPAQLQALAYTQGSDIHVAPGQEKHLAHEAWHVVQQKQGRVQPTTQLQGESLNDAPGLEREADVMGSRASGLKLTEPVQRKVDAPLGAGGAPIQRVAVQLGADDAGEITEVNVGGRAGSLWPSERHHTTPWQSYLDTLDGELTGLSFAEATQSMNGLDDHLRALPGWGLRNQLQGPKRAALQAEVAELNTRRVNANALGDDSPLLAISLQRYIQQWLVVRSKLPLAQADFGGGAGTVADDALVARTANTGGDVDDDDLEASLFSMFDFKTVQDTMTESDGSNADEEYEIFGLDPARMATAGVGLDALRGMAFRQHARSIRKAYPTAFGQLYGGEANPINAMVAAMEQHWQDNAASDSEASDDSMSDSE